MGGGDGAQLTSSAAYLSTAVKGASSGTLNTLYGSLGSDVSVILKVTFDLRGRGAGGCRDGEVEVMAMAVSPPLESSSSMASSAATERTYILLLPPPVADRTLLVVGWLLLPSFPSNQKIWKCFRKSGAASFFFFFFAVAVRGSGGCQPKPIETGATSARGDRLRGTAVARVHEQGGSLPPRRTCHLQTTSAPTEGRTWELATTARRDHIINNITLLGLSSTSVLDAIGKLSGLAPTCSRHTSLQLDLYALSSGRLVFSSFLVEEKTHAVC